MFLRLVIAKFSKASTPPDRLKYTSGKRKGSLMLVCALVTTIVIGGAAISLAKINNSAFQSRQANNTAVQAQQYAAARGELIRQTAYNDIEAQPRENIGITGFQDEVIVGGEVTIDNKTTKRDVQINVYETNDTTPRSTLIVPKYNRETSSGVPIGTIIAWPGKEAPKKSGTWLLCNGQSCAAYPELVAIVGNTVPNLNGRFLEGTTGNPGTFKDAGLPNITGSFVQGNYGNDFTSGAFYQTGEMGGPCAHKGDWRYLGFFDASRSSAVYGKSSTVQPAAYTVRYYIKADN